MVFSVKSYSVEALFLTTCRNKGYVNNNESDSAYMYLDHGDDQQYEHWSQA